MTIDDIIDHARLPLREALKYLKDNKDVIEGLYPNAYFECVLNVLTRNIQLISNDEVSQLIKDMEYFLTKETRYTSDSAIVYNFLSNINKRVTLDLDFIQDLEEYLYKEHTSYSFKYNLETFYHLPSDIRIDMLMPIYEGILVKGGNEVEVLAKYIARQKKVNHIYADNLVLDGLLNR